MTLAEQLEQAISLGIFLLGAALATFSLLAWRRERDRRMAVVTGAYALFSVFGLIVFLEYFLLPYLPYVAVELIEHGAALLILAGLLAFFLALFRE
jgi:CHASE2 domain-containing sensor protein